MNKIKLFPLLLIFFTITPVFVFAQPNIIYPPSPLPDIIGNIFLTITGILNIIASGFVIVMFVLTGFKYLTAHGDPSKVNEANRSLIWAFAGVAVLVISFTGGLIVSLVQNSLGL